MLDHYSFLLCITEQVFPPIKLGCIHFNKRQALLVVIANQDSVASACVDSASNEVLQLFKKTDSPRNGIVLLKLIIHG